MICVVLLSNIKPIPPVERKINLGSGPILGDNGWKNCDILNGADFKMDFRQGIPLPSNSCGSADELYHHHILDLINHNLS